MVREALALCDAVGGNLYIKVPATPQGLEALPALKKQGLRVTVTALFSAAQALLFARAGADFVAPFVSRLDNIGANGVGVVEEILTVFHRYGLATRVLAASLSHAGAAPPPGAAGRGCGDDCAAHPRGAVVAPDDG